MTPGVIVFDGVCNFCNASVNFVMKHDRRGRFRFASNQSEAGGDLLRRFGIDPGDVRTVYLVEGDRVFSRSTAALRIARGLTFPWSLGVAGIVIPRPIRDWVYDRIAANRYRWFGKTESCRLPTEAERARFL